MISLTESAARKIESLQKETADECKELNKTGCCSHWHTGVEDYNDALKDSIDYWKGERAIINLL